MSCRRRSVRCFFVCLCLFFCFVSVLKGDDFQCNLLIVEDPAGVREKNSAADEPDLAFLVLRKEETVSTGAPLATDLGEGVPSSSNATSTTVPAVERRTGGGIGGPGGTAGYDGTKSRAAEAEEGVENATGLVALKSSPDGRRPKMGNNSTESPGMTADLTKKRYST